MQYKNYKQLVDDGLVSNRTTLARWIRDLGFPPGVLVGPNTRLWRADDIEEWFAEREKNAPAASAAAERATAARCKDADQAA